MKHCTGCKQEKERSEYNKNLRKKDGLQQRCRLCTLLTKTPRSIQSTHSYKDYIEKAGLADYKQTYLRIN